MNLNQFKMLSKEKKLEVVEKRLEEMKEHNLKTPQFKTNELDITWPQASVEIKKLGYVLDQTTYKLNRIVLDNEVLITKKEFEEFKKASEEKSVLVEKNEKLSEQLEILKSKYAASVDTSKAEEIMMQVKSYIGDDTEMFYVKIPEEIVSEWKSSIKESLYDKQVLCEAAFINYLNKYTDEEKLYLSVIGHLKSEMDNKKMTTYSMTISKKLADEWKNFCKETKLFSISQITGCALLEYIEVLKNK